MAASQILIMSQHDLFAPSWQAGLSRSQCLKQPLKNYDVEQINVVKTCEQLSLAFKEYSTSCNTPEKTDNDTKCAVKSSKMPFRAFSNIWFGTLKIYQQQVNTLFHLSQDLFSRSCYYKVKPEKVTKRKSSLMSYKFMKKRRLTLSESIENPYCATNYSELLDDLERITQEPMQKSLTESSQSLPNPVSQFQIREITIREISATTYTTPDLFDEDSGFGEATHEEIAEFLNFVGDKSMFENKKNQTKRKKSICEQGSPMKITRIANDTSFEKQNENISLDENESNTSFKRSISPAQFDNSFDENKSMLNVNILQENIIATNDFLEIDEIKKENLSIDETTQFTKYLGCNRKKKYLIIDECTKIDISEIIEKMKASQLLGKVCNRRAFNLNKSKRNISASELLARFNRRPLKLHLLLKQKPYISREQFKRDYLNLLREIYKIHYNENWASEIYPKWKCFNDARHKKNGQKSLNKSQISKVVINKFDEVLSRNDINDCIWNEHQEVQTINHIKNMTTLNTCIYNEWRPYGVMVKLLNLWRFNKTNIVEALKLFKLAEHQVNRALGFNSLLNLSKKQFVKLTNFPESVELQNILMGKFVNMNITSSFT